MVAPRWKYLQVAKFNVRNYYTMIQYALNSKIRRKYGFYLFTVYLNSIKYRLIFPFHFSILLDLLNYLELQKFIVRKATIVDLGAYVGDYSLAMAALGAKKVLAFEPQRSILNIFKLNLKLNSHLADKIELYPYAVSNK
ncbi:MAG: FkbM family methyltransferase, partial [bacterium]|nr:FkbM family methyltransferase [bacterium]